MAVSQSQDTVHLLEVDSKDLHHHDHNSNANNDTPLTPDVFPDHLAQIFEPDFHRSELYNKVESASSGRDHVICCNKNVYIFLAAVISAIGGVLFGYDIGIISGALLQLREDFCLTCFEQEAVVSSMLAGAICASLSGGFLVDIFGRKRIIIINSIIFTIGAVILAISNTYGVLITGRVIVGFAVALSVIAECVYISEISPQKRRGCLVSLNELGIVVGFLTAYLINFAFINVLQGWRYMFGLSIIPAVFQGIGMCFLPTSPRYLMIKGKEEEAKKILFSIYKDSLVEIELEKIKQAIQEEKSRTCCDLFTNKDNMRFRVFIGMALVFLQQFTGQPNVLYYAPTIFQSVGFNSNNAATMVTILLGVTKVITCIAALILLDTIGRRKCLMFGATVMMLSITVLGVSALYIPHDAKFNNPCLISTSSSCFHVYANATMDEFKNSDKLGNQRRKRSLSYWTSNAPSHYQSSNTLESHSNIRSNKELEISETLINKNRYIRDTLENQLNFKSSVGFNEVTIDPINVIVSKVTESPVNLLNSISSEGIYDSTSQDSNNTDSVQSMLAPAFVKWTALLALVGFVAGYEVGFGTGTWLVLAEIYPSAVRGRAIALATVFNWGTNLIVSLTFLDEMDAFGVSGTFIPYGVICALAGIFVFIFLPETKNKSLEEIGYRFSKKLTVPCNISCCKESSETNSANQYARISEEVDMEDESHLNEERYQF